MQVNRGKLAVLAMLGIAAALAGFGLWWNVSSGKRTLDFWGREAGARIIDPDATVELLWLQPAADSARQERLVIGGRSFAAVKAADVTGARGLVHARHSLLEDASFDWETPATDGNYSLAVRFRDAAGTTTVALDWSGGQVAHVESGQERKAATKIVAGWKTFAQRHEPRK